MARFEQILCKEQYELEVFFPGLPPSSRGQGLIEPSIIGRLKAVLDQYPDDGQILKARIKKLPNQINPSVDQ